MMKWFILLFLVGRISDAHPLDLGFLEIARKNHDIVLSLELNPSVAAQLIRHKKSLADEHTLMAFAPLIISASLKKLNFSKDKSNCNLQDTNVEWVNEQLLRLTGTAVCDQLTGESKSNVFRVSPDFFGQLPASFQLLTKITDSEGNETTSMLDIKSPELEFYLNKNKKQNLTKFIKMGIEHIGAVPNQWKNSSGFHLPGGIDHILFLIVLLISSGSLFDILKITGGFTLGHSITLAVGSYGLIHLPTRIVECAIALSIVYVSYEAIKRKSSKNKWRAASLFGLVHGLGFAQALQELNLAPLALFKALIGFNLGVELGQIIIVFLLFPILFLGQQRPLAFRYATSACSVLVGLAGSYWFVVRALGS